MALPNNIKIILEGLNGDHNLNKGEYILDTENHILYLGIGDFGNFEGIMPTGDIYITVNGTYDVLYFENAIVNVPGGIQPSGTINISENGTYDVTQYANANVEVTTGREYIEYTVTGENDVEWGGSQALGALCQLINVNKVTPESFLVINGVSAQVSPLYDNALPDRSPAIATQTSEGPYYYQCPVFHLCEQYTESGGKVYKFSDAVMVSTTDLQSHSITSNNLLFVELHKDSSLTYQGVVYTQGQTYSFHDNCELTQIASCPPGTKFVLYY